MRIRGTGALLSGLLVVAVLSSSSAFGQDNLNLQSSQRQDADSVYAEIKKAPEKARAKRNPFQKDPDAVTAGKILFDQRCAECHGDNAEGGNQGPSLRAPEVQNAEPGAIFWILTNGVVRKGMPVWSKLPEPQRWQLVSFIKSLGPSPAKTEAPTTNASRPLPAKDSTSQPR